MYEECARIRTSQETMNLVTTRRDMQNFNQMPYFGKLHGGPARFRGCIDVLGNPMRLVQVVLQQLGLFSCNEAPFTASFNPKVGTAKGTSTFSFATSVDFLHPQLFFSSSKGMFNMISVEGVSSRAEDVQALLGQQVATSEHEPSNQLRRQHLIIRGTGRSGCSLALPRP